MELSKQSAFNVDYLKPNEEHRSICVYITLRYSLIRSLAYTVDLLLPYTDMIPSIRHVTHTLAFDVLVLRTHRRVIVTV